MLADFLKPNKVSGENICPLFSAYFSPVKKEENWWLSEDH